MGLFGAVGCLPLVHTLRSSDPAMALIAFLPPCRRYLQSYTCLYTSDFGACLSTTYLTSTVPLQTTTSFGGAGGAVNMPATYLGVYYYTTRLVPARGDTTILL
jgi:hypothetical protein